MPYAVKPLAAALLSATLVLAGCSIPAAKPKNINNVCDMYSTDSQWYSASAKAENHYGIPVPIMMAFIHQESRFVEDNRPAKQYFLGVIPLGRPSSAFGYSQALDGTWKEYQRDTGKYRAQRTDFSDSVDFIGWYNRRTVEQTGISEQDAYRLYLVYHEGVGGYRRGTHLKKAWLDKVAQKVAARARMYEQQLAQCQEHIEQQHYWNRF